MDIRAVMGLDARSFNAFSDCFRLWPKPKLGTFRVTGCEAFSVPDIALERSRFDAEVKNQDYSPASCAYTTPSHQQHQKTHMGKNPISRQRHHPFCSIGHFPSSAVAARKAACALPLGHPQSRSAEPLAVYIQNYIHLYRQTALSASGRCHAHDQHRPLDALRRPGESVSV